MDWEEFKIAKQTPIWETCPCGTRFKLHDRFRVLDETLGGYTNIHFTGSCPKCRQSVEAYYVFDHPPRADILAIAREERHEPQ